MYLVTISATLAILLSIIVMVVCTIISKTSNKDREKLSPFECGFDPKSSARSPFSIQFFLIAVLFLIFDIEIAIMLPIILTMKTSMTKTWMFTITSFIIILIIGLYHEWNNGVLEWAK
uniref:NADH-ubiquinone oxidoreductase chain 3 n=1 Tax=Plautia fimbriata TaxID=286708 RepID=A0A4D6X0J8_9HEMI|nr:NADH dehydrogenase subunit 3 [Plautia fimbriata]YP_010714147.1 NADH dehydrogenase subunit 3 [Plautia stali]QCI09423.1 NADH dehydrogenase subunit 3 [Plautia fimbriata]WDD39710.1 NADH dehydrogenase subunit 3 [Plautia stali]